MQAIRLSSLQSLKVDELVVHSTRQNLYTVRAVIENQYLKVNQGAKPYQSQSIDQILTDFAQVEIAKITLIQDGAYDEMIGQPLENQPHALHIKQRTPIDKKLPNS